MKKYDVTLTAHYEKTISVYADSPEQAKEKTEIILFDTDLIDFTDDDFVCGEAAVAEGNENGLDPSVEEDTWPGRGAQHRVCELKHLSDLAYAHIYYRILEQCAPCPLCREVLPEGQLRQYQVSSTDHRIA